MNTREMLDKVIKTLSDNKLINSGDTVLVALSGGPDSVCLLHVFHVLSEKLGITIHAIHINHGLRGSESDGDEAYTREICSNLGIALHVSKFDISVISKERKISLEEAGREVRYREFERLADRIDASCIAVAHNMNDQSETIFLNLIRGTGLQGLCGMDYKRGRIIRPLLDIPRVEIEKYCMDNALQPRIDSSNLKGEFSRNKIRLELMPKINDSFGVNFSDSLYRMSELVRNDNNFLEDTAIKAFTNCADKLENNLVCLDIKKLLQLHIALQRRVLRIAVNKIKGDLKGIESVHIDAIAELSRKGRTGSMVQLPKGIRAEISYSLIKIYSDNLSKEKVYFDKKMELPGCISVDEIPATITAVVENEPLKVDKYKNILYNSLEQFFDYDKLKKGINIRNRREGDVFSPFGSRYSKKIKEYFIDEKIPREIRDRIPLVICGNEVVWIIGYKTSDKFKVTENTRSIIKIMVEIEK